MEEIRRVRNHVILDPIMKRKQYISPSVQSVDLDTSELMLTVSGESTDAGVGDGNVGDETPDLVSKHNGAHWNHSWE